MLALKPILRFGSTTQWLRWQMFFVIDPVNESHVLAVGRARHGEDAVVSVPANVLYKIGWQGPDIEAGAVKDVLAVQGAPVFRLVSTGQSEGMVKVMLRPSVVNAAPFTVTQPSANLVLSARAVGLAKEPVAVLDADALPELDRAVAVVGLFANWHD